MRYSHSSADDKRPFLKRALPVFFFLYPQMSKIDGAAAPRWPRATSSAGPGRPACGDHLHFAVIVRGVFVDPREWWDPHWIQDNIDLKLK
jgi:hypothetical protein